MNLAIDPGPMARLEQVQADQNAPSVIFHRITEGETLHEIARTWGVPKGRFVEWFATNHADLYESALKVWADRLAHEALEIADEQNEVVKENGQKFDPDVPRDKLRIDTRLKLASKFDRARYGDKQDLNVNVTQWVLRLPTPAPNTDEWLKTINAAPTPALPSPAPEPAKEAPVDAALI